MCLSLLAAHLFANVSHKIHAKFICDVEVTLDKKRKIIGYMTEERHQHRPAFRSLWCVFFYLKE
jgi:hypothetical protein